MTRIVLPGGVLARAAAEPLNRRDTGADECMACGLPAPCPTATHASVTVQS